MLLRHLRFSHTVLVSLLAGASLSACSGSIDAPKGSAGSCSGEDCAVGADGGGANGASSGDPTDSDRPPGVGDPDSPNGVGWTTRFARLSNAHWKQTVSDLFYLPTLTADVEIELPAISKAEGYDTQAAAEATIAGDAFDRYQQATEEVVKKVMADSATLAKLIPSDAPAAGDERAAAFIESFGHRAYRRALSETEREGYLTLFKQGPALVGGDAFSAGMRLVFEAMLQSPHFLYRVETAAVADSAEDRKAWLSGDELATRLSYSLWGSMPSDELFAAAAAGELDTAEGVAGWAEKMLDDPRAVPVLLSFHEQTFAVEAYGSQDKDPALGVDMAALAPTLQAEARNFFEETVINGQGGIVELLTEPIAFVNEATAPLYGLSGITGDALQRVELDPKQRAGLLMQAGFLTKNATRKTSDPVHRGLFVLRQLLCDEPDPPPMMFELPSSEPGLSTREVYEKATACGKGCHDILINPPGFAFEAFDALGRVRTEDANKPIDATGELTIREGYTSQEKKQNPTTTIKFDGAVELMGQLATLPRVHECYARNWGAYLLARSVDPVERGAFRTLRDRSLDKGTARNLLLELVKLDTFRSRVSE